MQRTLQTSHLYTPRDFCHSSWFAHFVLFSQSIERKHAHYVADRSCMRRRSKCRSRVGGSDGEETYLLRMAVVSKL